MILSSHYFKSVQKIPVIAEANATQTGRLLQMLISMFLPKMPTKLVGIKAPPTEGC